MTVSAKKLEGQFRIVGDWVDTELANAFLGHLDVRAFSPSTVRSYAFDIVNFARFLSARGSTLVEVSPMMVFDWIDWQRVRPLGTPGSEAAFGAVRTAAASTANRRVAAVRALFEYLVMSGACPSNPVPSPRRRSRPGTSTRGLLGHLGAVRSRGGGRLVRQPQKLPESLPVSDVDRFLRSLDTHRDRAIVLVMLLGGLRAAEVRGLQLSDVDLGRRRLRVVGKGSKERHIPVDGAFFAEVAAYLRHERPTGVKSSGCFLVLRGATTGQPLTEAGLRGVFRRHREASGATRVRPHRLRHTYGTELASAGIDLLALRELMGHVSPDTTARYVHLSIEYLAAEYGAARATLAANPMMIIIPAPVSPVLTLRVGYLRHLSTLDLGSRALRERVQILDGFLGDHPDLAEWMVRPVSSRCAELARTGAWPVVVYAVAQDGVRLDLEFAGAKKLTGLAAAIEQRDPEGFAQMRAAGIRLGWTPKWVETILGGCLAVILAWTGGTTAKLTTNIIDAFETGLIATTTLTPSMLRAYRARVAGLRAILFDTKVIDTPPRRRPTAASYEERFAAVVMAPSLRRIFLRYVTVRSAVVRPSTVDCLINDLLPFAEYLTGHAPEIRHLRHLRRHHIEAYLIWNRNRPWRGRHAAAGAGRTVSTAVAQAVVLTLRNMLDDITDWGWDDVPTRRLVFRADIPKLAQPLPRALASDVDAALMAAVDALDDPFARIVVTVLRHTGLRIGELLDLELGSVYDYGPTGSWLKVPLSKLATERMVPLDATALGALDRWTEQRGPSRALPHPRTGNATDFLFTHHGRRLGATRIRNGLITAGNHAQLRGADGTSLIVTPHQLRHTWATELANAGMSLQALMALLCHATAQMTVRYATLASPTLRVAYDDAVGKMRRQLTLTPVGRPIVPDKVAWLNSEMIKTRVAHGYCSRHESAGACSYANICENCANFTTGPEFTDALAEQLDDIQTLKVDAERRGWDAEAARHATTTAALTTHLHRLRR